MIAQDNKIHRCQTVFLEREGLTFVNLRDLPPVRISLTFLSDLKVLDQILDNFDKIYQPWIPKKDWLQCQLALAEGFTNAVRHAHKDLSRQVPIEIEIILRQTGMEIRIWDYGNPFDLEGFMHKNLGQDNRWSGHGQGLPILQQIADRLSYTRTSDNRNCLLIVKQFSLDQPEA